MKLVTKTVLTISAVIVASILLNFVIVHAVILPTFRDLEHQEANANLRRVAHERFCLKPDSIE